MEKQYNHQIAQQECQDRWQQEKIYQLSADDKRPLYSIDTPPPTVSGSLHIGHVFSYTQTDIIARFKRFDGFGVFYPFGFDDNGLPTERFVEKKNNVKAHNLKRSEFISLCLKETIEVEKQFEQLWQSLGLSADFSKPYSTISATTQKLSQESFIYLFQKGHIYRKNEPALYCTTCHTSVAQAELDDAQKESFFNDIAFTGPNGEKLIIGTTRPELLPACVALLYNPQDSRYAHLKGKQATVPLFGYQVPIISDELVDPEKGTGLVMCCTFGDKTDIIWFKKYNLPYRQMLTAQGVFAPQAGIIAGKNVTQAREVILAALKEQGLLLKQQSIVHTVNIHERCKKEIEYIALPQWFLRILDHKQKFIDLAHKINWYPDYMKSRYINWVENLSWDWCLSRQRFFGIPFPVWHCNKCKAILLPPIEALPIDPQETPYPGSPCPTCGSTDISPDTDVMDTWNTSSITPYICAQLYKPTQDPFKATQFLPMSMRPQAHDIIRTWAFYTIVKTWFHNNTIPWKDIVISGHVLASSKEKLSKSKENSPFEPNTLLAQYPADVIRYWTASATLGTDIAFSDTPFKLGNRLITKMWNAYRFIQMFIEQNPVTLTDVPSDDNLGLINKWLLDRATTTFATYHNYFEKHEFKLALDTIEQFFWHDFCDNYLELIKDQLFKKERYDASQIKATAHTLYAVGMRMLQWFAPYMPYITETIYQDLYKTDIKISSLHQTSFGMVQQPQHDESATNAMNTVLELIANVRKLKTEQKLSLGTELATLIVKTDEALYPTFKALETILQGVTRAQLIDYTTADLINGLEEKDSKWYMTINLTKTAS